MSETTVTTPGRVRPRRLRRNKVIRDLAAETQLSASQFIVPHFVLAARRAERPIPSMPGIAELGVDNLVSQVASDLDLGIRSVLLFGHPDHAGHKRLTARRPGPPTAPCSGRRGDSRPNSATISW